MNVNALGLPIIDDAVIAFVFFLAVCFTLIWRFWDQVDSEEWRSDYDEYDCYERDERDEHNVCDEYSGHGTNR